LILGLSSGTASISRPASSSWTSATYISGQDTTGNYDGGDLYLDAGSSSGGGNDGNVKIGVQYGDIVIGSSSGHVFINGETTVAQSLTVQDNLHTDTFVATGNANVGGTLNVTGATTLSSTLTVDGETSLASLVVTSGETIDGDLTVSGTTSLSILDVSSMATITGDLTVDDSLFVGLSAKITGLLTVYELNVTGDSYLEVLIVGGNATFMDSVVIDQSLSVFDLTVGSDAIIDGNLTVGGDATVSGRLALPSGPLSFSYPGINSNGVPINFLSAVEMSASAPQAYYLYQFAQSNGGTYFTINLGGGAFYQLEPYDEDLPMVSSISTTNYEVGDIIILKGSSKSNIISFWDYEDLYNVIGPTMTGNLYNGRDLFSASLNFYTQYLYSDCVFIYMYSPRTLVGVNTAATVTSVDWVKIN